MWEFISFVFVAIVAFTVGYVTGLVGGVSGTLDMVVRNNGFDRKNVAYAVIRKVEQ